MARQQLQVLNTLDLAKSQLYNFTTIIIAGMGFSTDAYDLFSISLVTKLLGRIYYYKQGSTKPGTLPPSVSSSVSGVALVGTLAGQLFFGWLGDKMGRKRFWLGFDIGGDYPLSATIMSEYANKKTRGAFIAAVFAMQGLGILAGGIVSLIVSAAFDDAYNAPPYEVDPAGSTVPQADYIWRIILMIGAVPAALTYYWRMKMPETARYTALVAKNAKQAAADMAKVLHVEIDPEEAKVEKLAQESANSFVLFSKKFARRHGLHLLGSTSTWFLLDIAFYSQNLFQKDVFSAIGTVPGYWFTVAFIDIIGSGWEGRSHNWSFRFLYAAQNTDPNKADAGYPPGIGVKNSLIMLGCINFLGMCFTLLVPEPKGKSLEELSGENDDDNVVPADEQTASNTVSGQV
ncbi:hypothetical protein F0562_000483 [Nyssa sinensis]|uniref:Major facilitator superfamily (MFS) profile domain-containing protein n=1 Tax=Nyssa sinensis TaxID=561372 RepID=A0A5J5C0Q2_9ASTE|nr:hypothetical protein F0562_000483 [Nyssa sinensis]